MRQSPETPSRVALDRPGSRALVAPTSSTASRATRQPVAPRKAVARPEESGGRGVGGELSGTGFGGLAVLPGGFASVLTAAKTSTAPLPTNGFHPPGGWWAVDSIRCMTCRAFSVGNRARISAASPLTNGAAKLVPESGADPSDVTPSPVAATSTHGPARVNADAAPSGLTEPTVNTKSSYHAGLTATVVVCQLASARWAGHCPAPPLLPAAATTTAFL